MLKEQVAITIMRDWDTSRDRELCQLILESDKLDKAELSFNVRHSWASMAGAARTRLDKIKQEEEALANYNINDNEDKAPFW